jgi:DNA-binding NarL/FixJ family response regulator
MDIKVSIVDDHPLVINGLQNMFAHYPFITLSGTYNDGDALLEGLTKELPDVLLLDIQMPGKTGDELLPTLLKKYTGLKIIALTNFDSTLYANNMFKLGVKGYVLKSADEKVIVKAIETVYNGGSFIEEGLKEKMAQLEEKIAKSVFSKFSLTPREIDVLKHIVNGETSQEIANKLFLSLRTVENYRLNIQLKLEVKNTAMLVKKALQMGLVD